VTSAAHAVPVVQTFHALGSVKRRHQGADDTSPRRRIATERRLGRDVDGVLATCSDEVDELLALGVPRERIGVAPCGVDAGLLRPDGPAEPRGRRHRIGVVARLVPRKGVDTAVEALGLLAASGRDDVELVVVGGGDPADPAQPERDRLQALAVQLGVADRVVFRGAVAHDRLPEVIRSLDALVCVPWYEPFGIVPLEAMACGVPVVGAAVGGLLDTVTHEVTGLHVPPRDPRAVAAALARLLEDPALAARLGASARRRVERTYTWERVAALTERFYARVQPAAAPAPGAVAAAL
jgi:D-inositol-3-phosphate glycosyltransferase